MFGKKKKNEMMDFEKMPDFGQQYGSDANMPQFGSGGPPMPGMPLPPPELNMDNDNSNLMQQDVPSFKDDLPRRSPSPTKEEVEEISETIFSEKTEEFVKKLDELKSWQKNVISKLDLQEKEIGYLRGGLNGFRDDIDSKLADCQKGIKEITIEIKVMEKIFSEIMPTFVEKIKELAEITDKLRGFSSPTKTEDRDRRRRR